jgi:penicillin-binding protein 2
VYKKKADQVWFPGETISMGIGQGPITVTPLQQAHFAAEIAERGKIIAPPRLVAAIRPAGSNTSTVREPVLTKPIGLATDDQWNVIYDGMVGAVTQPGATAYAAFIGARYKLAGKTGTAQVVTVKQTESTKHQDADVRKREHAWFIAFAPVDNPRIAISVLVENGGFGGSTAGPIARKVLDTYLLSDEPPATPPIAPTPPPRAPAATTAAVVSSIGAIRNAR